MRIIIDMPGALNDLGWPCSSTSGESTLELLHHWLASSTGRRCWGFISTSSNCNAEMASNTDDGEVIRVPRKGQATIPKELRERFGIDTPGKVLIHEEDGKIVVEPLPSVEEMQGVHAGRYEKGKVLEHLRE